MPAKTSVMREESDLEEHERDELDNLDARLRRAEQAYQRILHSLNIEPVPKFPKDVPDKKRDHRIDGAPQHSPDIRPRILKLPNYDAAEIVQRESSPPADGLEQYARSKALVPPLRFPSNRQSQDDKLQVIEESNRSERDIHVSALRSALRPVRLERPVWIQEHPPPEVADNGSNGISAQPVLSSGRHGSSLENGVCPAPRSNPRDLVRNIFAGYSLEYPNGKAATPKWQKQPPQIDRPLQQAVNSNKQPSQIPIIPVPTKPQSSGAWSGSLDSPSSHSGRSLSSRSLKLPVSKKKPENSDNGKEKPVVKPDSQASDVDDDTSSHNTYITRSKSVQDLPSVGQSVRSRLITVPLLKPAPRVSQPVYRRFRGRSLERYMAERAEREISDLEETKRQFRAHPLPSWIHEQRMRDMKSEEQKRKERVQNRAKEMLEQVKPFEFRVTKDRKRVVSEGKGKSVSERAEKKEEQKGVVRKSVSERGRTRTKGVAEAFRVTVPRTNCHKHLPTAPTFQPHINHSVPDFARLHAKLDRQREDRQEKNFTTVPRPFHMNQQPAKKDSRRGDSPTGSQSAPSLFKASAPDYDNFALPFEEMVRPTKAFKLMTAFSKQKIEEDRRNAAFFDEDPVLVERVRESLLVRDEELGKLSGASKMHHKNRVSEVHESQHGREYLEMLSDVRRRLSERPFMWERTQMEERKRRIEAKFQEILQGDAVENIFQRAVSGTAGD
ncbi:uncharacterized protein LOC129583938 [Paramacrobiotus metropolitanus]|uniref:uncharacterized protein LOC129583938 n=1 Tax=Paramacrobiotus metropolitanus TaxID=2943436 RepID=UPI00244641AE|nr:uncharacterized protein LOC129583938 [Paramacrobiotus metropolitanus]